MIPPKTPKLYSFNFVQDVPDPTLPVNTYVRGQNFINYGINNLYPDFIAGLYQGSAINKTCLTSKHLFSVGNGLKAIDSTFQPFLDSANSDGESWNDIWSRAVLDYLIFGGCALQIIWNELGDKIIDVYNMSFGDIRSGHIDKESDKVEWYYYSADWGKYRKDIFKPKAIKSWDPAQAHLYPNQLLYFYDYVPGPNGKYYPVPSYSGGLTAAQVDISIDAFHFHNIQNGLHPSLFIEFRNGIPSMEEMQDTYSQLASSFSGVQGAGRYFLSFAPDAEHGTQVTPIESANDDYYIQLSERLTSQLTVAHRITSPLLLGIKDIGGSGLTNNKDEITVAALHFQTSTIAPTQKTMLRLFNKILSYTNNPFEVMVEPLTLFNTEGQKVGTQTVTEDTEINAQPV